MNREEEIKRMLKNGFTFKQIADFYGITKQAIHNYCKRKGLERKPFDKYIPKVKSEIQLLRESGKEWCQSCHAVDVPLIKNGNSGGRMCRSCNAKRMKKYYHTQHGRVSITKSKIKYYKKKKAEKALINKD
jgi:predicted transcriptional regulator